MFANNPRSRTVASANFGLNFGFESGLDEISEEQEREAAYDTLPLRLNKRSLS